MLTQKGFICQRTQKQYLSWAGFDWPLYNNILISILCPLSYHIQEIWYLVCFFFRSKEGLHWDTEERGNILEHYLTEYFQYFHISRCINIRGILLHLYICLLLNCRQSRFPIVHSFYFLEVLCVPLYSTIICFKGGISSWYSF